VRRIIDSDTVTIVVRLVVGLTFLYASYYKIVEPGDFAKSIWYYHIVPGSLINLMAVILPWVELVCGVFLILGVVYRGSVVLVGLMTVVFILAIASAMVRGIDLDCGCFKAAESSGESIWRSLLLDVGLIILLLQLYFSRSKKWLLSRT